MKVALIHSGSLRLGPAPLASISLAAMLRSKNIEVEVINFDGYPITYEYFLRKFDGKRPDVIGFTAHTMPMLERTCILTEYAKKEFPDAKIFWGGVHASIFPKEVLNELPVDVVVVGEGDFTILELINSLNNKLNFSEIKGIAYRKGKEIIVNQERPIIEDLNVLPMPAWDMINFSEHLYVYLIESRGCPFRCRFCYNKMRKRYRTRSVDNVVNEIKYLYDTYKLRTFKFWDDLPFGGSKEKMIEFCEAINSHRMKIMWSAFTRNEMIDESVLKAQEKAGCIRLSIGVESGSQRMLDKINKSTKVEKYVKSYDLMNKFKMSTVASMMIGLPDENYEDLKATLRLAKRIKATEYYAQNFKPYPGTDMYPEALGKFKEPENIYQWARFCSFDKTNINLSNIKTSDLLKARKEIFSLENRPKKWFYIFKGALHQFKATPFIEFKVALKLMQNSVLYKGKQVHPQSFDKMVEVLGYNPIKIKTANQLKSECLGDN